MSMKDKQKHIKNKLMLQLHFVFTMVIKPVKHFHGYETFLELILRLIYNLCLVLIKHSSHVLQTF